MKNNSDIIFVCSSCGNEFSKWSGRCGACGEWNSLKEAPNHKFQITNKSQIRNSKLQTKIEAKNLGKEEQTQRSVPTTILTNISEFDRVLGKGIVRGGVYLLAGEPGIGKSTLATQVLGKVKGLYAAAEESPEQIGMRVGRLGLAAENFEVLPTNNSNEIWEFLDRVGNVYDLVVVDSVQMFWSEAGTGSPGSVGQIKQVTMELVEMAKKKKLAVIILGHVTKEGDIAGPKLLEHMVDTVLYFEGDKNSDLRILRVTKNRFGPTDEVGVFRMEEGGLKEVRGDEINLVGPAAAGASAGKAVTIVLEGTRAMMVEIQALVVESFAPMPKRVFSGIDYNRGQLLAAVAQKILGMPLYKYDIYVAVTGGIKIEDTGADVAIVGAMWSSYKNKPIFNFQFSKSNELSNDLIINKEKQSRGVVLVGEVSLLGEVKKVRGWERRIKEAKNLGWEVREIGGVGEMKGMV